jgi:hypothetical protein
MMALDRRESRGASAAPLSRAMADIDIQRESALEPEDDYTWAEIAYWVIGILCIPGVPILMAWLFSPWSGM